MSNRPISKQRDFSDELVGLHRATPDPVSSSQEELPPPPPPFTVEGSYRGWTLSWPTYFLFIVLFIGFWGIGQYFQIVGLIGTLALFTLYVLFQERQ